LKEELFGPFRPPYTSQIVAGALLVPLFGQFQKACSPKVAHYLLGRCLRTYA
jgi:hypothetical protein